MYWLHINVRTICVHSHIAIVYKLRGCRESHSYVDKSPLQMITGNNVNRPRQRLYMRACIIAVGLNIYRKENERNSEAKVNK